MAAALKKSKQHERQREMITQQFMLCSNCRTSLSSCWDLFTTAPANDYRLLTRVVVKYILICGISNWLDNSLHKHSTNWGQKSQT